MVGKILNMQALEINIYSNRYLNGSKMSHLFEKLCHFVSTSFQWYLLYSAFISRFLNG